MGVIDWKSKNIEDELSIYVLVSQSLVDQLGESLRIKKANPEKRICPIEKTISQHLKTSKTCLALQKSPQLSFGDTVLRYHKKISPMITFFHCRYLKSAFLTELEISPVSHQLLKSQYIV